LRAANVRVAVNGNVCAFAADFDHVRPVRSFPQTGHESRKREPETGANAFRRRQTQDDPLGMFAQVRGSPIDPPRLSTAIPDLSDLHGMQKVRDPNPLSSTSLHSGGLCHLRDLVVSSNLPGGPPGTPGFKSHSGRREPIGEPAPSGALLAEDGVHGGGARADHGLELMPVNLLGDDRGPVAVKKGLASARRA
jgi:hypothetical protein